ncbi:hypothetical protein ACYOEI_08655 [Singulisphaera rosea]
MMKLLLVLALCSPFATEAKDDSSAPESSLTSLAGDYGYSDGFTGHALSITPEGRYTSETDGCMGLFDCNSGSVEIVAGGIRLEPDRINLTRLRFYFFSMRETLSMMTGGLVSEIFEGERRAVPDIDEITSAFRGLGTRVGEFVTEYREGNKSVELVPVRWGKWMHLVPREDASKYCNLVNLGWVACKPAQSFFLRGDDAKFEPIGLPDVPGGWKPMLLLAPLDGQIEEVKSDGRARIDLGIQDGIWKGMWLDTDSGDAIVVRVSATTAIIERTNDQGHPFRKGERFSSKTKRLQ